MTGPQLATALLAIASSCFAQTPPAGLQVSVNKIEFGETVVDSQSPGQIVILSNPTQSKIVLTQILTSGIDFSEQHDCASALEPGAQCTIQAFFKPAISGQRQGNLVITGSDPASPHFIPLTGTGK